MIDEGYTKASIANTVRQFIWSAYKDYLRQNGDSLVVYSPASYFNWYDIQSKTMHLKFDTGFGFNRKHFHASDALVTCIKWDYDSSYDSVASEQKEFPLQLFEINKQRQVVKYIDKENIVIKNPLQVHHNISFVKILLMLLLVLLIMEVPQNRIGISIFNR